MLIFGIIGYFSRKFGLEGAPFLMALVLGPIMEKCLRQSLLLSRGDLAIFFTHPISAILLGLGLFSIMSSLFPYFRKSKERITEEGE
jgi:putative tricarboxylic transport membrane protein